MKNNKLPNIVILLILTLITTLFWISFNVYRVFTTKPDAVVPQEISLPIDPKLDTNTLDMIKSKSYPNDGV